MSNPTAHHVKSIYLSKLFGRYTYSIPRTGEILSEVNILYGENGLGKTTLLSLVFHLLSPSPTRNHATTISTIPFDELVVTLHDGTIISAKKDPQLLTGPVAFSISDGSQKTEWNLVPNSRSTIKIDDLPENIVVDSLPPEMQDEIRRGIAQRMYFRQLGKLKATAFMLTSDRILLGDTIDGTARDLRRASMSEVAGRAKLSEIVSEQRIASVTQALSGASTWLQAKFVERSYVSGESATRVYQDVVNRIVTTPYKTSAGVSSAQQAKLRESLTAKIEDVNRRSREFTNFGFARVSVSPNLLSAVATSSGNKLNLIGNILDPHLEDLKARLDNIEPFYRLVSDFVSNVNKFFRDKHLVYSLRTGVRIISNDAKESDGEITPQQLSSGEQQLMLIFCHVLTARDTPNIFIIDEPEISLNILWQRMLIDSLQKLAEGSETQFIFASHSMEILAKHRKRVVSMEAE